jgi:dodecin
MPHHDSVVKVIELVGSSEESFSDAVRNAVRTASQTIRNIKGVDVLSSNAEVEDGQLTNYRVQCKIAFVVDAGAHLGQDEAVGMRQPQPRRASRAKSRRTKR